MCLTLNLSTNQVGAGDARGSQQSILHIEDFSKQLTEASALQEAYHVDIVWPIVEDALGEPVNSAGGLVRRRRSRQAARTETRTSTWSSMKWVRPLSTKEHRLSDLEFACPTPGGPL